MELATRAHRADDAASYAEITEFFAVESLRRVRRKQRFERLDDLGLVDVFAIQAAQTVTGKPGAKVKVVAAGPLADESDLGDIRSGRIRWGNRSYES